jgi:AraC family transcriptional regulator
VSPRAWPTCATSDPTAALLRDWLPDSGWQLDGRPTFELYPPADCDAEAPGRFACDIVIPPAPL